MQDKPKRSLAKAVSWRITGTVDTIVVSFLVTGHAKLAVSIGCVEFFTKLGLYYLHERAWNLMSFGRSAPAAAGQSGPAAGRSHLPLPGWQPGLSEQAG